MHITISWRAVSTFVGLLAPATYVEMRHEAALVARARKRDNEAFSALVDANQDKLRRFIARRVREADREDVLQETWVRAWTALPKFSESSRLGTWLYAVCYHTIQDYWRREQHRPDFPLSKELDPSYLPKEFNQIELADTLRIYWAACTPDQRELLTMYYADGLVLPEISRVLGRNLNTVKYQFYRAHEEARKALLDNVPEMFAE